MRANGRSVPVYPDAAHPFSRVLARNIDALVAARAAAEHRKPMQDRIAAAISQFAGSMLFVGIHAVIVALWIVWNLGWIDALPPFDPTFVVLAMAASVEAIFLSTFVLITQNRMQEQAERRAELDLQISLLAEHEVTQVMTLLDAVARRLGVEIPREEEVEEAKRDVDPSAVLHVIDEQQGRPESSLSEDT
jgi:uncharacterized membrane protein